MAVKSQPSFKLKLASATLNSFKHSFFIRITGGGGGGGRSSRSSSSGGGGGSSSSRIS